MNIKFKGTAKELRTFLNNGLITDENGATEFEFKEDEGIVGVVQEDIEEQREAMIEDEVNEILLENATK